MRGILAAAALAVATCTLACGSTTTTGEGSADITSNDLTFHAESAPLSEFQFDTGLVPAGSPAQIELKASAGGSLVVDAAGIRSDGKLAPKPGSGHVALDLHAKLDGRLKIDSSFKKVDGDIPGLKDIDIPIKGDATFDPFLTADGDAATATAEVPEGDLPPIPLGSVPGKLTLHVEKGSVLTTSFHGTCASVTSGQASYTGEATTSGTLVLSGKIALDLPAPLNKSVDVPAFSIKIPKITKTLDLGTRPADGLADGADGASCAAANAPADGSSGGSTSSSSGGSSSGSSGSSSSSSSGGTPMPTVTGTLTIDGTPFTFDGVDVWAGVSQPGMYDAFIKVHGPGVPSGSDFSISATHTGTGCANTDNFIAYRPEGDTQYMPQSPNEPDCGLAIEELPTAVGGHFRGSFYGTLYGINQSSQTSKLVELRFDAVRAQ